MFEIPGLTVALPEPELADETSERKSSAEQLLWRLAEVCTDSHPESVLYDLKAESCKLVGFGPMVAILQGLGD